MVERSSKEEVQTGNSG